MCDFPSMLRLKCASQTYDWGKRGMDSIVYQLQVSSKNPDNFHSELPYAELWMGTHHSGPSYLWNKPEITLETYINEHPACLGKPCLNTFGRQLPFLFKVLSVAKALSIQAHPDKELAVRLHAEQPDVYKDDNHKPEMAIALTDFEALLGFRPLRQILAFVRHIPELADLTSGLPEAPNQQTSFDGKGEEANDNETSIKSLYSSLMRSSKERVEATIKSLVGKFTRSSGKTDAIPGMEDIMIGEGGLSVNSLVELFLRLNEQFPLDVGCLSVFFLNYVKLKPGEAIFLAANTPHAYLSGDCIECMANSDNVVRAGLTPKFKDVSRLLDMLEYKAPITSSALRFAPLSPPKASTPVGVKLESFVPPVSEFALDLIQFDRESRGFSLPAVPTGSIIIFLRGQGIAKSTSSDPTCPEEIKFGPGHVYFVAADTTVNLVSEEDKTCSLHACRAYVNRS
ncbi:hypothetical protein Aperf_G00000050860 [Anoplocephala perfoliata]